MKKSRILILIISILTMTLLVSCSLGGSSGGGGGSSIIGGSGSDSSDDDSVVIPGHVHSYGAWEIVIASTCNDFGSRSRTCSECENVQTEPLQPLGHNLTSYEGKAATCTEGGYAAYQTCSRCEYTTYTEIKAKGHKTSGTVKENSVAATCEATGSYESVAYCVTCKEEVSRNVVTVAALGHNLTSYAGKTATCVDDGYKAYKVCSRCSYTTYEVIEATGHNPGSAVKENQIAPTCEATGSFDYVVSCVTCGVELSRTEETIEALGHRLTLYEKKAATCTLPGYEAYESCSRCEHTTYEEIPALGHTIGEIVRENVVVATCETTGGYDEARYCTECNVELARTSYVLNALGHKSGSIVIENEIEASCVSEGSYDQVQYCTVCDAELIRKTNYENALGHSFSLGMCTRCDDIEAEGLSFMLSDDGTYYILDSVGSCTLKTIVIPSKYKGLPVKSINGFGESNVENIYIPASVTYINQNNPFQNCAHLVGLDVAEDNTAYATIGSALASKDGTILLAYPRGLAASSTLDCFTAFGNTLQRIENYAFAYNTNLEAVDFTTVGAITLGDSAFYASPITSVLSTSLESWLALSFENYTSNPLHNGAELYFSDARVTSVTVENMTIPDYAFYGCSSIQWVTVEDMSSIGNFAFSHCSSIFNVELEQVKLENRGIFANCDKLSRVDINGSSIHCIGKQCFADCDVLANINFDGTKTAWYSGEIDSSAFDDCNTITVHCSNGDITING